MDVHETQLPGVGTRFTIRFDDGGELVVMIHLRGNQEVYWHPTPDADSQKLCSLTERQARKLAEIFDGTYVPPITDGELEAVWDDAVVEWVELGAESAAAGNTLGDLGIRTRTGVSVIAVQRESETVSNPSSDFRLEDGDVVVAVGSADAHERFERFLLGAD